MLRLIVLIGLLTCVLAAPAAQAEHLGRDDPDGRRLERAAVDLLNDAARPVYRRAPCRVQPGLERADAAGFTDAEPSEPLRSALGVLRRAPTAREIEAAEAIRFPGPGVLEVYRRGARFVGLPDGTEALIRTHSRVRRTGLSPEVAKRCDERILAAVRRVGQSRPAAVRRRALAMLAEGARAPAEPAVTEGLALDTVAKGRIGGGTAGRFVPERFAGQGMFLSMGSPFGGGARKERRPRSRLVGLVPDPVASAELEFTRFASRGPYRSPKDYGGGHRVTVEVTDNVVFAVVPRHAEHAFPARMVWRDAAGQVVRVVRPPAL